jgi:hypothetical protein
VSDAAGYELWIRAATLGLVDDFEDSLYIELRREGKPSYCGTMYTPQQAVEEFSAESSARGLAQQRRGRSRSYESPAVGEVLVSEPTVACVVAAVRAIVGDGLERRALFELEPRSE